MKISPYLVLLVLLLMVFFASPAASGIPITSSQGKTVDFAGVKSASSAGLEVQVKAGAPNLTLPWSRLDLKKLETENPKIHEARKKTLSGEKVALNLGSFAPKESMEPKPTDRAGKMEAKGIYERVMKGKSSENFSTLKMALKVPGGKAKGIFIEITGAATKINDTDQHFVAALFDTTTTALGGRGPWYAFAQEQGLAIAGISVDEQGLKKGAAPHHEVGAGIGDALFRMIDVIADASKREDLKTAPLILYGRDVGGGAFVYNLSQWKPERVAVAVAAKGAFYNTEPTAESVKVPFLFIQGEYDNDWELFNGKNIGNEVFEKHVGMAPNWTLAIEPRGTSGDTVQVFALAQAFLKKVTPMRIGSEGLKEMDRASAWLGEFESKKTSKAGGVTEWTVGKTWLPDAGFAKSWEEFANGNLQLPSVK